MFASTLSLEQHKEDRKRNRKANACPVCCRSFFKHHGLTEHQITKDHWSSQDEKANALEDKVCLCGNVYHSAADLEQHMSSRKHEYRLAQRQVKVHNFAILTVIQPIFV